MNHQKEIKQIKLEFEDLERMVHESAVSALFHAKDGHIDLCNDLIYAIGFSSSIDVGRLISWFEKYGRLKWNNKKGRLVCSNGGAWKIQDASNVNALSHEYLVSQPLTQQATLKKPKNNKTVRSELKQIHHYLAQNPIDDTKFGKFGVPADKNRWGKYKLKMKRK